MNEPSFIVYLSLSRMHSHKPQFTSAAQMRLKIDSWSFITDLWSQRKYIAVSERRATNPSAKEARSQQILAATAELLERWSYADITMDRIAERAGVAKGTLYLYFRTKEALFLSLYEDRLGAWYAELQALGGSRHRHSRAGSRSSGHRIDPRCAVNPDPPSRPPLLHSGPQHRPRNHARIQAPTTRQDLDSGIGPREANQKPLRLPCASTPDSARGCGGGLVVGGIPAVSRCNGPSTIQTSRIFRSISRMS